MIQTNRFELSNGLRVVHNADNSTAMVAVNILYDVGARDENPDLTGLAHLFEHLMFGGSENIPDFDNSLERAGGMSNAWTSNDFTNFYDILPAHNAETAFWLESDRMMSLSFSEKALEVQRHVVIEEFKQQCLNKPYGDTAHHLRDLAYREHPYRYPVIGSDISHIEKVSQDDVRQFFFSHYAPNNAVLSVSGNISESETRRLAEKWFGEIPQRDIKPRLYPAEPPQNGTRIKEVTGNVPRTALTMAWHMDGYGSEQYFAADLLTDLLANGQSSRFYRKLLMNSGLFSEIDASILGSEEPGLLLINAKLTDDSDMTVNSAIDAIDTEIKELAESAVSQREITRAVNRMESAAMFSNMSYLSKAQVLAAHEYHGEDINDMITRYRMLTPENIRDAAAGIFDRRSLSMLIYRPA